MADLVSGSQDSVSSEVDVQEENLWDLTDEELEDRVRALRSADSTTTSTLDVDNEDTITEQPETDGVVDSDNNSVADSDAVVKDEASVTTEPTSTGTTVATDATLAEPERIKYKANGKEFEFTKDEIVSKFGQVFGQAMDYTKKMQAIAPYRTMISAIEDAKISKEDLNLAIEVLKGDKTAIASLLKRTGVDALELDLDSAQNYRPNDYGRSEVELNINDVISSISGDPEYATTANVLNTQWDAGSVAEFAKNPELIRDLHIDVKSGVFGKVAPIAETLKVFDGGRRTDLEYYKEAGRKYYAEEAQREMRSKYQADTARQVEAAKVAAEQERAAKLKAEEDKRAQQAALDAKRKAAATSTASRAGTRVSNYLDNSDEAFDEWYNNLQNKY